MATRQQRNRVLLNLLKSGPCTDCGGKFPPVAMDFDHIDPMTKSSDISHMMSSSQEALIREIAKCDLVCANCHRARTRKRQEVTRQEHVSLAETARGLLTEARERLIDKRQVMAVLNVSRATIDRWRKDPAFPPRFGGDTGFGRCQWRLADIEEYIVKRTQTVVTPKWYSDD